MVDTPDGQKPYLETSPKAVAAMLLACGHGRSWIAKANRRNDPCPTLEQWVRDFFAKDASPQ